MAVEVQLRDQKRRRMGGVGGDWLLDESTLMTRAEHKARQVAKWSTLFEEHRTTLIAVAEMLLNYRVSPDEILDKTITALGASPVRETFGPASAIRAVVKTAVAHNCEVPNSRTEGESQDPAKYRSFEGTCGGMLPWPERAVYFLRGALPYSRRETALLLGMSDSNIDQLYKLAEERSVSVTQLMIRGHLWKTISA